jgi:putative FmdB family regulatory protein
MPIFEYQCDDCGTKFEKLVRKMGGVAEQVVCPSCGRDHLQEQYSTFAAHAGKSGNSESAMPSCPSGMCQTPGMCGRNFN